MTPTGVCLHPSPGAPIWQEFGKVIKWQNLRGCKLLILLAPQVGLEPTTLRLTARPGDTDISLYFSGIYGPSHCLEMIWGAWGTCQ